MINDTAKKSLAESLREAIETRDWLGFSRACFKVTNVNRRALFQGDRPTLERWYRDLSSLLTWFYRKGGEPEWPEAQRSMGGLEMLLSLMGNFLETRTLQETLSEVRRSAVDRDILLTVAQNPDGIRSGDLAARLAKQQNSVTNRLPALERMGLIVRSRIGKNSVIYPTPKGRGVAEDLRGLEKRTPGLRCAPSNEVQETPWLGLYGEERRPEDGLTSWASGYATGNDRASTPGYSGRLN